MSSLHPVLINFEYGLCKFKYNLLPLIRQLRQNPKVVVRAYYPTDIPCESALRMLLDTNDTSWYESLSDCISSIVVKMYGNCATFYVTMKRAKMDLLFQREQHSVPPYASLKNDFDQFQWEIACAEIVAQKGLDFGFLPLVRIGFVP